MTAFDLAQRYVDIVLEVPGNKDHPLIQWWLSLCGLPTTTHDEIPWCSAFCSGIAWQLRLPRSKSLAARSWLGVGQPIQLKDARPANDVVVLNRAGGSPNPDTSGPGHVGFYAGQEGQFVLLLGGNQGDKVSVARFAADSILGIRRLA
jgi:uncharacterized protein (TIGR02594 family)